jgi:hypothetical protein
MPNPANDADPVVKSTANDGGNTALDSFLDTLNDDPEPTESDTKPADSDTKPADSDTKPADSDIKPADGDIKPADGDIKPADGEETKPAEEPPKPESAVPFDLNAAIPKDDKTPAELDDGLEAPPEVSSNPKAAHAWAELKGTNKSLIARTAELETQLADATKNPGTVEEIARLRGEVDKYEERLGQVDLASSATFRAKYEAPMSKLVARGVTMLTKTSMTKEDAGRLVAGVFQAKSQDKINELTADLDLPVQGALLMAASEYGTMLDARTAALNDWKNTQAATAEQTKRDQEVAFAQMAEKDMASAIEQARAEGNWMFRRTEGADPKWDEAVDALESTVRGLVKTASPQEIIKWMVEGVTAKPSRELFAKEQAQVANLQAELHKALGTTPDLNGGGGDHKPAKKGAEHKPISPDEYINTML